MTIVGDHVYAILITPTAARAARLGATREPARRPGQGAPRDHLDGRERPAHHLSRSTSSLSHQLYRRAVRAVRFRSRASKHLIFEPDGAMLRLPPNLLVMDQAVGRCLQQRAQAGDDAAFDFRGIAWLGRDRDISTSVSPRSFAQLRSAPPSAARKEYLGLGQNTPPSAAADGARARRCRSRLRRFAESTGRIRSRARSCRSRARSSRPTILPESRS